MSKIPSTGLLRQKFVIVIKQLVKNFSAVMQPNIFKLIRRTCPRTLLWPNFLYTLTLHCLLLRHCLPATLLKKCGQKFHKAVLYLVTLQDAWESWFVEECVTSRVCKDHKVIHLNQQNLCISDIRERKDRPVHQNYWLTKNVQYVTAGWVIMWYTPTNKNPSVWNFLSPELEVTWRTVAIIIRVVFLAPYLCIRGVSLSSIHHNQSHRVHINRRQQYICLIWNWNINQTSLTFQGARLASYLLFGMDESTGPFGSYCRQA